MARVIDQLEPVVVLVGHVLSDKLGDREDGSCQVLVQDDLVVDAPSILRDFLIYISTPRLRSQAVERLANEGCEAGDLDGLIASERVRELPSGDPSVQLRALAGVRLIPMGHPARVSAPESAVVWVGHTPNATALLPVSGAVAALMWEAEDHEDLPATVQRLARSLGGSLEDFARLCLVDLDGLLGNQLARLELLAI